MHGSVAHFTPQDPQTLRKNMVVKQNEIDLLLVTKCQFWLNCRKYELMWRQCQGTEIKDPCGVISGSISGQFQCQKQQHQLQK